MSISPVVSPILKDQLLDFPLQSSNEPPRNFMARWRLMVLGVTMRVNGSLCARAVGYLDGKLVCRVGELGQLANSTLQNHFHNFVGSWENQWIF